MRGRKRHAPTCLFFLSPLLSLSYSRTHTLTFLCACVSGWCFPTRSTSRQEEEKQTLKSQIPRPHLNLELYEGGSRSHEGVDLEPKTKRRAPVFLLLL